MVNKSYLSICLILLATISSFAPAQSARAMTAEQYFADGNRLRASAVPGRRNPGPDVSEWDWEDDDDDR